MPSKALISKAFAVVFAILTIASVAGMLSMIIVFKEQTWNVTMTARPTDPITTMSPPPNRRLPKNLVPERYDIFIWIHLYPQIIEKENITTPNQTMSFTGNSTVHFHCVQKTMSIFLHSKDLIVSDAEVRNKDNEAVVIKVDELKLPDDERDFLEIALMEALEAGGNYSLFLAFKGELSNNLEGLYLSTYTEGTSNNYEDPNAQRFIAATNMEPTNARRVFPCFDEPEMKAVFKLTVTHRKGTTVLGNEDTERENLNEWKYTEFRETPRMSTYLFAFVVSDFQRLQSPSSPDGRPDIFTYARPEAIKQAEYAADITRKILEYYEREFEINYQMKKLDQIALPDLSPGAMENWGLITYQEGALLYQEGVSSLLQKETVATIIAHELAHQWFGNLVTMKWWNDLWLKEGFATYMSYFAVDAVEPSFSVKDIFFMDDLHNAFEEDALASSHPLSPDPEDIETSNEIIGMFDAISYSKGAVVLRMLADYVGDYVFNKGVKMYLKAFEGGNTNQDDLWTYLQKADSETRASGRTVYNGHSIASFMHPWTKQSGYPVITIDTTDGGLTQNQFLYNSSAESSLYWPVSIRYMTNISAPDKVYLPDNSPVHIEKLISTKGEWFLANINCTGYYRVNYNAENWERLLSQLERDPSWIPLMNRGQLVDDAFNLARAKLVSVTLALNSTVFLHNEKQYLPWESAVRNLEYFILMFDRSEVYGPMQVYLREQVQELYNDFRNYTDNGQVPENDHSLQHTQLIAINLACSNGLPECIEMAKKLYSKWMESNATNHFNIHPNLRSEIYCQALAAGGTKEWEFAWDKYQASSDTSEKDQLREALSCTKKTWLLNRYLGYTLDPEKIRLMDVVSTVNFIAKNAAGQALAWNFIRAHWNYVSQGDAAWLIEGVTSRFSTEFELKELERFQEEYDLGGAYRAVSQAIEQTQVNIQWVKENKNIILDWFERRASSKA